jgi:hypothetical protein
MPPQSYERGYLTSENNIKDAKRAIFLLDAVVGSVSRKFPEIDLFLECVRGFEPNFQGSVFRQGDHPPRLAGANDQPDFQVDLKKPIHSPLRNP